MEIGSVDRLASSNASSEPGLDGGVSCRCLPAASRTGAEQKKVQLLNARERAGWVTIGRDRALKSHQLALGVGDVLHVSATDSTPTRAGERCHELASWIVDLLRQYFMF
jgi:hypothetical protein